MVTGVVKNLTEYGAFVDLGGIDGLLHVTDMSYGRVRHPSEVVHVGDEITVKVLKFDRAKERVSLGMKQLAPDPWETVAERYPVNSRVIGRVVSVTDYGAFVELEPGVEGLIHITEMTWSRRMKHPSQGGEARRSGGSGGARCASQGAAHFARPEATRSRIRGPPSNRATASARWWKGACAR